MSAEQFIGIVSMFIVSLGILLAVMRYFNNTQTANFKVANKRIDDKHDATNRRMDDKHDATNKRMDEKHDTAIRLMNEKHDAMNNQFYAALDKIGTVDSRIDDKHDTLNSRIDDKHDDLGKQITAANRRIDDLLSKNGSTPAKEPAVATEAVVST